MYGFRDPRLNEEPIPYLAIPLWQHFWILHDTRQISAFGSFQPISFTEVDAYSRLMQIEFDPWEISALKRMDGAFLTRLNNSGDNK